MLLLVERNLDYVLAAHSAFQQMRLEEIEQEIALSATADSCNDLDESVALCLDQPVEIEVSFDFHGAYYIVIPAVHQEGDYIFRRTST